MTAQGTTSAPPSGDVDSSSKGRKRGGPRRISRDQIVEIARRMDPQTLTMQAIADELGVDRKALNYHVTDRDGLLRLLADDIFASTFTEGFAQYFAATGVTANDDWRAAVRAWATTVRDSMVATGVASTYFRLAAGDLAILEPAELVLQQMLRAGFDLTAASRCLIVLTRLGMGVGRDVILQQQLGEHPQSTEVHRLLDAEQGSGGFEAFREMVRLEVNSPADIGRQFEFEVDLIIAGMDLRLSAAH